MVLYISIEGITANSRKFRHHGIFMTHWARSLTYETHSSTILPVLSPYGHFFQRYQLCSESPSTGLSSPKSLPVFTTVGSIVFGDSVHNCQYTERVLADSTWFTGRISFLMQTFIRYALYSLCDKLWRSSSCCIKILLLRTDLTSIIIAFRQTMLSPKSQTERLVCTLQSRQLREHFVIRDIICYFAQFS